jgi:hypothetical protein
MGGLKMPVGEVIADAIFPGALKTFTRQKDGVDTMDAADVNEAYAEIEAMQAVMGIIAACTTTGNTITALVTLPIPNNSVRIIQGFVTGRRTGGAGSGAVGDCAIYLITMFVKNTAGALSTLTGDVVMVYEDQDTWNVDVTYSGANFVITVTGAPSNNIDWEYRPAQYLPYG